MSRKLEIQVEKLFRMVEDLERRLIALEGEFTVERGYQGFYVCRNGEKLHGPYKKDDAAKIADEMNGRAA